MGSGIALAAAQAEDPLRAYLVDVSEPQLERARAYHAKTLKRSVDKGDRKSTRLNFSHSSVSRMPSSA